jgi:outer membrane receptor protein involved in Fe transport
MRGLGLLTAALAVAVATLANQAGAQTTDQPGKANAVQEVVVTALKTNQTLETAPVTADVVPALALKRENVTEIRDLNAKVPGLYIVQGPVGDSIINVRGLGTNTSNPSFELSVAAFYDGVYAGHSKDFNAGLFDLSQVEIIKGTQSTLLGKNTSLGAISFVTRKPGREFGYDLTYTHTFNPTASKIEGGVDLPLNDTFRVRLAGLHDDDDGYYTDRLTGQTDRTRQDGVRATAVWEPIKNFDSTFTYQHERMRRDGMDAELVQDTPTLGTVLNPIPVAGNPNLTWLARPANSPPGPGFFPPGGGANPGVEAIPNGVGDWGITSFPASFFTEGTFPNKGFGNNQAPLDIQAGDRLTLTENYRFDNGFLLKAITGWIKWRDDQTLKLGFSPLQLIDIYFATKSNQLSQELRLNSPEDWRINFTVGGLYFKNEFFTYTHTLLSAPFLVQNDAEVTFNQNTSSWSGFGQANINVTDKLRLTGGLRLTDETKDADFYRRSFTPGASGNFTGPPVPANLILDVPAGTTRTHHEQNVDGSAGLEYQFAPRQMVYAFWGKGSKSGGFQAAGANTASVVGGSVCKGDLLCGVEYGPEETTTIEAGTKLRFDHDVYVAFAIYQEQVNGFQYTQTQPFPFPTVVTNLDLRSRGIDFTGTWRPLNELALSLGANYAKVVNTKPGISTNPTLAPGTFFPADQPRNPHWTVTFNADWTHPVREKLEFSADLQVSYKSSSFLQPPTPANLIRFPIYNEGTKVDLALSLRSRDGWEVSLLGKNLTDNRPVDFATTTTFVLPNAAYGTIDPPRTFALQISFFH